MCKIKQMDPGGFEVAGTAFMTKDHGTDENSVYDSVTHNIDLL